MNKLLPCFFSIALICTSPMVTSGDIADASIEAAIDAGFGELEHQLINKYFGDRHERYVKEYESDRSTSKKSKGKKGKRGKNGLPPGLAKKGKLPPGLAKRETLPPGLASRGLPSDLEKQLPPPPAGYERRIIEDAAIVLVHIATGEVIDIIKDVVIDR